MIIKDFINHFRERLYYKMWDIKHRERKASWGNDYPNDKFYVIRRGNNAGLFSVVHVFMGHLKYAQEHGYIPVIDMKNYSNAQLPNALVGKENSWEYFFEQPGDYSLDQIGSAKNVILSYEGAPKDMPLYDGSYLYDINYVKKWHNILEKFVRYSDATEQYISEQIKIGRDSKAIGVVCRGTDYTRVKMGGHYVQPSPMQILEKMMQVMKDHDCDEVFIATEDEEVFDFLKKELSARNITMKYVEQNRYIDVPNYQDKETIIRENRAYMAVIDNLSRCRCLIGGRNNGTMAAIIRNNGQYEYVHLWDMGKY